jgi:hypothetical protein
MTLSGGDYDSNIWRLLHKTCATTTLWGASLGDQSKICRLGLQEFDEGGNKSALQIIKLAQRKRVIFLKK